MHLLNYNFVFEQHLIFLMLGSASILSWPCLQFLSLWTLQWHNSAISFKKIKNKTYNVYFDNNTGFIGHNDTQGFFY